MTSVARLMRSEEHTSELQSLRHLVCRLLLEKKKHNRLAYPQARRLCGAWRERSRPSLRSIRTPTTLAHPTIDPHCDPIPSSVFFFNDTATTEIYTLSLHDALPI